MKCCSGNHAGCAIVQSHLTHLLGIYDSTSSKFAIWKILSRIILRRRSFWPQNLVSNSESVVISAHYFVGFSKTCHQRQYYSTTRLSRLRRSFPTHHSYRHEPRRVSQVMDTHWKETSRFTGGQPRFSFMTALKILVAADVYGRVIVKDRWYALCHKAEGRLEARLKSIVLIRADTAGNWNPQELCERTRIIDFKTSQRLPSNGKRISACLG